MGSSYFGCSNLGNERSSRKGKRSNGNAEPNKPKQPQRGLGVAQLEKIRLLQPPLASAYPSPTLSQEDERMQTSYPMYTSSASSSSYGFHVPHDIMVGSAPSERTATRYDDSRPSTTIRWNPTGNGILDAQQFAQHGIPEQFWNPQAEEYFVQKRRNKSWCDSIDARQNFQAIDDEELDLELRL